jgi:hypothetical protein
MNRWVLAIAVILMTGIAVRADYVIIRVNLAASQQEKGSGEGAGAGVMQPGGLGGMQPGGMQPGGMQPGGRPGFGGRGPGGRGPGGMQPGGMQPGGMQPGGLGGIPGGRRGGRGMEQQQPGGRLGPPAGIPTEPTEEETASTPVYVQAVIEVKHEDLFQSKQTGWAEIRRHQWGKGFVHLYYDAQEIDVWSIGLPTVLQRFETERKKIKEGSPDRAEKLFELAKWALQYGLVDKVPVVMDELAKVDPKYAGVAAFQKLEKDMDRDLKRDDAAVVWKDRLGTFKVAHSKHYTLIHDVPNEARAEEWLKRLEQNYRGFFYWFALHAKPLPLPDRRLVAVLVESPDAFERQHKDIFDGIEMVADGFYDPRENLAVFSASRLDEGYDKLRSIVKVTCESYRWDENDLLQSKGTKRDLLLKLQHARAQTLTLLKKAMEDEAERATVTHEGTRQLLEAVGLVPRSIELPRWIDFGMPSFFETPKGSFWPGVGAPSQLYLAKFKRMRKERNHPEVLRKVVSDWYFHQASQDPSKEKDWMTTARTMSWALTYFLVNKKQEELLRYYQELRNLPRDLEFDEDVLLGVFARAFGLADSSKPNELDENKLAILAEQWYTFMGGLPLEIEEKVRAGPSNIGGGVIRPEAVPPGAGRPGPGGG